MRYELTVLVDSTGRVIQTNWAARDDDGELFALGCAYTGSATILPLGEAAERAYADCVENVLRNQGVQETLTF